MDFFHECRFRMTCNRIQPQFVKQSQHYWANVILHARYHHLLISMGQYKKDVTPLLTHWSYVFLAVTHWYILLQPSTPHLFTTLAYNFCKFQNNQIHTFEGGCLQTFYLLLHNDFKGHVRCEETSPATKKPRKRLAGLYNIGIDNTMTSPYHNTCTCTKKRLSLTTMVKWAIDYYL